jgi:hypothetical protein
MPLLGPWIRKIDEDLADAVGTKEVLQGHLSLAMDQADVCQSGLIEASGKMLHPSPRELNAHQVDIRVVLRLSNQKYAVAKTDFDHKWGDAPDKHLPLERPLYLEPWYHIVVQHITERLSTHKGHLVYLTTRKMSQ